MPAAFALVSPEVIGDGAVQASNGAVPLRDYQEDALRALRATMKRGTRRIVLCSPTGSGKTHMAAALIQAATKKDSRMLFVAERLALVSQASDRLHELGIPHGILQGENRFRLDRNVIVCSSQTLEKRLGNFQIPDLVVVDECHIVRQKLIEWLVENDIRTIGLSATPFTEGLDNIYGGLVNASTMDKLREQEWLVPCRVKIATPIDMDGAPVVGGEWSANAVEQRALPIVGDIVSEWQKNTDETFGGPVPTLVFSATVAHGEELRRQFIAAGFRFEQISYKSGDSNETRKAKLDGLSNGTIDGIISCEALGRGVDIPNVRCLVLARPYRKSLASVLQQLGRGMRPADGKPFCLVIDHASRQYLRFADQIERFWARGIDKLQGVNKKMTEPQERPKFERMCKSCDMVVPPQAEECPYCGAELKRRRDQTEIVPGAVTDYSREGAGYGSLWEQVCLLAQERHNSSDSAYRFALAQYRNISGHWPTYGIAFNPGPHCDPEIRVKVEDSLAAYRKKMLRKHYASKR